MTKILAVLCFGFAVIASSPAKAHIDPVMSWSGNACTMGAANFAVCSSEPKISQIDGQCYVSHFENYIPNPLEMKLIGVCQAAKAVLSASPSHRKEALGVLKGWKLKLQAEVEADPSDAESAEDAINSIGTDFSDLNANLLIYQSDRSPDSWDDVQDSLEGIVSDAQVWGGG